MSQKCKETTANNNYPSKTMYTEQDLNNVTKNLYEET